MWGKHLSYSNIGYFQWMFNNEWWRKMEVSHPCKKLSPKTNNLGRESMMVSTCDINKYNIVSGFIL